MQIGDIDEHDRPGSAPRIAVEGSQLSESLGRPAGGIRVGGRLAAQGTEEFSVPFQVRGFSERKVGLLRPFGV